MPSGLVRISRSPSLSPPLRSRRPGRARPVTAKPSADLGALGAVAADQRRAGRLEHVGTALQHVEKVVLGDRRPRAGGRVAIASAVSGTPPIA